MDATLESIRNKLGRGEELSTNDLRLLDPLHDAIFDGNGYVKGSHCNELSLMGDFNIDFLDRKLLNERGQHGKQPQLVRYIGMVQDMLDPEYYESCDSLGRSRHFGDHFTRGISNGQKIDDDFLMQGRDESVYQQKAYSGSLSERTPLVVVPIPFASQWIYHGIHDETNSERNDPENIAQPTTAVVSPISVNRIDRKRYRNETNSKDGAKDCENTDPSVREDSTVHQSKQKTGECVADGVQTSNNNHNRNPTENSTNTSDWWPAGNFGTSSSHCPVLAKLSYDKLLFGDEIKEGTQDSSTSKPQQMDRQRPLMLNDIVSMVGVLSMNPFEADFSGQRASSKNTKPGDPSFGEEQSYFENDLMDMETTVIPPPSRLPRIHVLNYRKFDLDDLARRAIYVAKMKQQSTNSDEPLFHRTESNSGHDSSDDDSEVEWSGFPNQESLVPSAFTSLLQEGPSSTAKLPGSTPWIRALWTCLLSDADRREVKSHTFPEMIRAGPADRALGCVSLRLATPDSASAKEFFHRMAVKVLPGICPIVATVDLTTTEADLSFFPCKNSQGRLNPCPLQLPKGSVLLIHYPTSFNRTLPIVNEETGGKGSCQINDHEKHGDNFEGILKELVQHHRLPYKFEGGVMIPFEADYRIIIVTTQTQSFPCTISVLTGTGSSSVMTTESSLLTATSSTWLEVREALSRGRSIGSGKQSPTFPSDVLKRAQKDFLERRQRHHKSSASAKLPGEDDFHRWLTLTKLQTKNRASCDNDHTANVINTICVEGDAEINSTQCNSNGKSHQPTVEDWEAALKLDDDVNDSI